MEKEFLILSQLEKNELSPQREIASVTGLSLGTVNLLLKKMTRKGLVKIERLNKRNLRYILTPRGVAEKSSLAYRYARRSYRLINLVITAVQKLVEEESKKRPLTEVIFYGQKDDFGEILALALSKEKINYCFITEKDSINVDPSGLIIVWDEHHEQELNSKSIQAFNILKYL